MRLRAMVVLVAAAAAVTALAGCQTKVGQAAVVNGVRLSDSDLSKYVTKQAVPFDGGNGQLTPKVFALESWIDYQLFEQSIRKHGGPVTAAERTEYEGLVFGGSTREQVSKSYTDKGFTTAMSDLRISEQADFSILAHRLHPKLTSAEVQQGLQGTLGNEAVAEIAKLASKVSVSGRYGSWDPKTIALPDSVGSGLPPFVTFGSGAAADANR